MTDGTGLDILWKFCDEVSNWLHRGAGVNQFDLHVSSDPDLYNWATCYSDLWKCWSSKYVLNKSIKMASKSLLQTSYRIQQEGKMHKHSDLSHNANHLIEIKSEKVWSMADKQCEKKLFFFWQKKKSYIIQWTTEVKAQSEEEGSSQRHAMWRWSWSWWGRRWEQQQTFCFPGESKT